MKSNILNTDFLRRKMIILIYSFNHFLELFGFMLNFYTFVFETFLKRKVLF